MPILFGCSVDNVGLQLNNIYAIGELTREATAEDFSVVRMEGSRRVRRKVTGYNLDAIISVGYRESAAFHDRFLAIDDRELYLVGASLKDLGRKCLVFNKMEPAWNAPGSRDGAWEVRHPAAPQRMEGGRNAPRDVRRDESPCERNWRG